MMVPNRDGANAKQRWARLVLFRHACRIHVDIVPQSMVEGSVLG